MTEIPIRDFIRIMTKRQRYSKRPAAGSASNHNQNLVSFYGVKAGLCVLDVHGCIDLYPDDTLRRLPCE
jgi:hypothetical protein